MVVEEAAHYSPTSKEGGNAVDHVEFGTAADNQDLARVPLDVDRERD